MSLLAKNNSLLILHISDAKVFLPCTLTPPWMAFAWKPARQCLRNSRTHSTTVKCDVWEAACTFLMLFISPVRSVSSVFTQSCRLLLYASLCQSSKEKPKERWFLTSVPFVVERIDPIFQSLTWKTGYRWNKALMQRVLCGKILFVSVLVFVKKTEHNSNSPLGPFQQVLF